MNAEEKRLSAEERKRVKRAVEEGIGIDSEGRVVWYNDGLLFGVIARLAAVPRDDGLAARVEARIAEVIRGELTLVVLPANYARPLGPETHADVAKRCAPHVAAVLAPLVAGEVARAAAKAWDEGWEHRDDCDPNGAVLTQREAAGDDEMNPYRAAALECNAMGVWHGPHVWDFGSGQQFACPGDHASPPPASSAREASDERT